MNVKFYKTTSGKEPVREWLKDLSKEEKKKIGEDIKKVQFGWPIGMPLTKKMDKDLWEIRIKLIEKWARIFFTIHGDNIILLHGFMKKSDQTPQKEIQTAKGRMK